MLSFFSQQKNLARPFELNEFRREGKVKVRVEVIPGAVNLASVAVHVVGCRRSGISGAVSSHASCITRELAAASAVAVSWY